MQHHQEDPSYKALYFDLKIDDLKKYYSKANPKGGYFKLQRFLENIGFEHEQYSGYHSTEKTTDYNIFNILDEMQRTLPWLSKCARKFEVANIGENYDLTKLFPKVEI